MATTYSFLDVVATFSGPDGVVSLGYGSGAGQEGITIEMIDDKDLMTIGADGTVMHSLRASNACRISVRILKTSPTNNDLNLIYNSQRFNPANWGQNNVSVRDVLQGDVMNMTNVAFSRQPSIVYAQDANLNDWQFLGVIDQLLGAGLPDLSG